MEYSNTGNKETCNTCLAIWGWEDDRCPECGSKETEEFHTIECECSECKQLVREDPSLEESIEIMAENGTLHDFGN